VEIKTEGIVLKRNRLGEKDDITYIFTRDIGKIMVSSRGTRKLESKLKYALELFSMNRYQLVKSRKDSKYFALITAEPINMFQNMRSSLRKIGFCYLVVELLNKFTEIEDPHPELYDSAKRIMHIVEDGSYSNIENVESYFKLAILKYAGYSLVKDTQYLKDNHIGKEIKELLTMIEQTPDIRKLDIEYDVIREINMAVDAYVIYILGEDVFSNKFINGLHHEK
jgi:hypothetical protein